MGPVYKGLQVRVKGLGDSEAGQRSRGEDNEKISAGFSHRVGVAL